MTFVIGDPCVDIKDRNCVANCPVDCIYEGATKLYINPEECIECGACENVCPVSAIFLDIRALPEQEPHIEANRAFFDKLGASPGGAKQHGPQDYDSLPGQPII
ncbi:ferredoxin [Nocardia vaccinii]|uniref:ferredoxin n=1 Tax=Nocardia vaccinii TaxID=1822 RepID=UPI00082CFEEB|nr:ferredoxin [Nocardia vaccinii]